MSKPTDQIFITRAMLENIMSTALMTGYDLGLSFAERRIKNGVIKTLTTEVIDLEVQKIIKSIS